MKTTRKQIANESGISPQHFSNIINGVRRPSWDLAKMIAKATNSTPEIWMDGTPEQKSNIIESIPKG